MKKIIYLLLIFLSAGFVFSEETSQVFSQEELEDIWQQQQEIFDGVVPQNNPYVLQLRSILNQIEQISNQIVSLSKETMSETQPLYKQIEDINKQIDKLYQQLYNSYSTASNQINAQIRALESKREQLSKQIDQIFNQKYNQLQTQLNKLQAMLPQVMAMIEQVSSWNNYPEKFNKFKELKNKLEKKISEQLKEVKQPKEEKPKEKQESQTNNYNADVVDLSDKKSGYIAPFEQPTYSGPLSKIEVPEPTSERIQKSYFKIDLAKDISLLEPVVELTNQGLKNLQDIGSELKEKIKDYTKEKILEKAIDKIPGASLTKELIENFKENFDALKEANDNALINIFKASNEATKYLVYGEGDVEFVLNVDKNIAKKYEETAKKLMKENISTGLEGYSGIEREREPTDFSEPYIKHPKEHLKTGESFKIPHPDAPRWEYHKQNWFKE